MENVTTTNMIQVSEWFLRGVLAGVDVPPETIDKIIRIVKFQEPPKTIQEEVNDIQKLFEEYIKEGGKIKPFEKTPQQWPSYPYKGDWWDYPHLKPQPTPIWCSTKILKERPEGEPIKFYGGISEL